MHINKKSISESIEDSMKNNKPNVKRMRASNPQSVVNPVMDDALKSSEEFDKNSEKAFTDLSKKSKDITPQSPTTGKKVNRRPYTEGFKLDESLFDDPYDESLNDTTSNRNAPASRQLLDYAKMRENQDGNGFAVLRNFVEYGSDRIGGPFEDYVRKYINDRREFPDGLWGDLMGEDLDLSNDEDFDTYSNFNSDLYNAMSDVVYDYSSKGISKKDIEKAVEWFLTHFFDDYDEDKLEENKHIKKAKSYTSAKSKSPLSESRWDDYDDAEELDQETVYDFIDERLFGVSYTGRINGGNYRATNKFCSDVWMNLTRPGGATKKTFFYPDHFDGAVDDESRESSTESRRAPTSDGIAVYLRDESEGNLAKAVADELELDYKVKQIGSYNKTNYKYIATIVIPDYIAEMPIDEYLPTIGKSITDYKKPRKTSKATKRELVTV